MSFASAEQFERAGKIVRHLMYQNTLPQEEKSGKVPYFNYKGGGTEPVIGVEGHKMVYISIPSFSVRPENLEGIRDLPPIKERDSIVFSEDGFNLYVEAEKDE